MVLFYLKAFLLKIIPNLALTLLCKEYTIQEQRSRLFEEIFRSHQINSQKFDVKVKNSANN
jgi:hypothetical protein